MACIVQAGLRRDRSRSNNVLTARGKKDAPLQWGREQEPVLSPEQECTLLPREYWLDPAFQIPIRAGFAQYEHRLELR